MKTKITIAVIAAVIGAFAWQAAQDFRLFQKSGTYVVVNSDSLPDGRLVLLAQSKWNFGRPSLFLVSRGDGGEIPNKGYPPAEFTLSPLGKIEVTRWAKHWGTQAPWLSQD
jgi:hypothetical protein